MSAPAAEQEPLAIEIVNGYAASWERWLPPYAAFVPGILALRASGATPFVAILLAVLFGILHARRGSGGITGPARIRPGELRLGTFRLRARDVEATTTARIGSSISIAIQRRGAREPVMLLASSEADASRILDALGAGETGAGIGVAFPRPGLLGHGFDRFARASAVALSFLAGLVLATSPLPWEGRPIMQTIFLALVTLTGAIALHHVRLATERIVLERQRLRLGSGREILYREIEELTIDGRVVLLRLANGAYETIHFPEVAGAIRHFPHHLQAAVTRAHGPAVVQKEAPPVLSEARPAREWIAELDAAATQGERRGYRDATLDLADVEAVLADADRPLAIRAAAARVLLKRGVPPEKVAPLLDSFRGGRSTARARIVAGLEAAEEEEVAEALDALKSTA